MTKKKDTKAAVKPVAKKVVKVPTPTFKSLQEAKVWLLEQSKK